MDYSIIIRCYNKLPLVKKCVEAAIQSTDFRTEIILVNNHPPYQEVTTYLNKLKHPRVTVLDPQRNIGNAAGFNYGAQRAKGEYLIILDDDIIVPKNDWIDVMSKALNDFPDTAYVSLVWQGVRKLLENNPNYKNHIIQQPEYNIYFDKSYVVFGCVMLKKSIWKKYFSDSNLVNKDLYGIDGYYKNKANQLGMRTGYILSHVPEHLGRTKHSDLLYGAYKVIYAYGLTKEDFVTWRRRKPTFTAKEKIALLKFGYHETEIKNLTDNWH
ncbi:glycosyltransferase family 2 protein [Metabacillus arenae]|uniref:glycosyltransferase family 2 protein n=1 Tax=Metabacillus arenae TaxID=2771434 RepID=UPI001CD05643|nr:glycosyltransferase family A protein [Metabacillus arenae]